MTEDIRSMLTSGAKVPPRNSALKFSNPKKNEEPVNDLPLKDEEVVTSTPSKVVNTEETSEIEHTEETLKSPAVAEEPVFQDKPNKQRLKTVKNDIQQLTSNTISIDNDSAKPTARQGLQHAEVSSAC